MSIEQNIKQEVLHKHRRETRIQSFGMIIGIAVTMFVAMTMMDMVKLVTTMHENQTRVMEVQSAHTGIQHLSEFDIHRQQDIHIRSEITRRISNLESFHKK